MKSTAWAVVPVLAVMAWVRYAPRAAAQVHRRPSLAPPCLLALAAAPDALATPDAIKQNLIDYPLGTSAYKTVAASPLPGHLIASSATRGHLTVDALLLLAVIAFAGWLLAAPAARRAGRHRPAHRAATRSCSRWPVDPVRLLRLPARPASAGWRCTGLGQQEKDAPERKRPALIGKLLPQRGAAVTS